MHTNLKPAIYSLLLIIIVGIIYLPGLSGGFIFDDFNNLHLLSIMDGQFSLDRLQEYLAGQKSGPVGRPISSLTFLLDGMDWPVASVRSFKITNLIIHLINTVLLFVLMVKLFGLYEEKAKYKYWLAFIACAMWAAHPFFVSTTMYVVQRMAMLPATFTLIGMLLYLQGRLTLHKKPIISITLMVLGVWGCTLFATLSKENGVLLLLLIWLFEYLILRNQISKTLSKRIYYILIVLPSILLFLALIYKFPQHTSYYDVRSFDLYERLLTQSRVLFKYLYYIWVPDYLTEGVFNDGVVASKSLFQPITTLFSVLGIGLIISLAWIYRKKQPLISFTILFFFIGHLLESTYLPLELYYEHRNYLPAMFMFVPISLIVLNLKNSLKLFYTIPVLLILFLMFFTFLRTNIWSNNFNLHYETAMKFPESARATNTTASLLAWEGEYDKALEMLEYGIQNHNKLQLRINRISLLCEINKLNQSDLEKLYSDMKKINFVKDDLTAFRDLLNNLVKKDCYKEYGKQYAEKYMSAFVKNKLFRLSSIARKFYYYQSATVNAQLSKYEESLDSFKKIITEVKSLNSDPVFESTALQAIDYLKYYDTEKGIELGTYYKNYCQANFKDCTINFLNQIDKKINNARKNIPNNSSQE
ncbi:hypothetical protein [Marinicella gelatinilytica]|uniref:hypothetical protein n=1 Tax=Marinicella gelatinilytica TaxID=2996017 RepID=UPI002260F776|nr:hypothetical protein [Marinicella gelatinilytica]MCX7544503.1 hypothetical protein [Marinicella gelatinilytica]